MARQLWFLRHGDAEAHGTRPDFDRRLTPRGERQARAAGVAAARLGLRFDAVFASPRVRALDTARLALEAAGEAPAPVAHDALSGGFDEREAVALAAGFGADARLLLVGHEPDFSATVHALTGARVDMKKGGVAAVRLAAPPELIVLVRPRELAAVAGEALES